MLKISATAGGKSQHAHTSVRNSCSSSPLSPCKWQQAGNFLNATAQRFDVIIRRIVLFVRPSVPRRQRELRPIRRSGRSIDRRRLHQSLVLVGRATGQTNRRRPGELTQGDLEAGGRAARAAQRWPMRKFVPVSWSMERGFDMYVHIAQ